MTTFWPKRDEDGRHITATGERYIIGECGGPELKPLAELLEKLDPDAVERARYILELRDEIKSLRAEVELLKPNKPKCGKCGEYKESYTHFSMATGMTNMHWICLNNECQE